MSAFDFDEVNLVPRICVVNSRSECDTRYTLKKGKFLLNYEIPVFPANMECVIDTKLAIQLAKANYPYSMHRFGNTVEFAKQMAKENLPVSISIGVNEDSKKVLNDLKKEAIRLDILTIDIAHGHAMKMQNMIHFVRKVYPEVFLIAGNVSTPDAVQDLETWGADAIKVGIGPGSACTTYPATGFGSRGCQASTIQVCSRARLNPNTKIIADGGIREPGDIAKSLALGADMVMVGGMMSGFLDSPGTIVSTGGKTYKEFWGSASHFQSNKSSRIEGTKNLIEMKPQTLLEYFGYLKECLQSSISYAGGNDLSILKCVSYVVKH